ncbi:Cas10/Cmr2 second palm domain-containing protein [Veillonella criceti]|uniref:CRISPR-associated protein Cas10/Csm1, subtype III-A/MTUBE n=1 Tax=Veillonella criceti TaxID=103891 RepID=A0A380NM40_9FIRM|nr:hypothetical protein [Veillonella criceti]SUP43070.1 CRISPR-associated protein Cas10/Csm1, subtype III-A/MTUBE [Veillonella criceti]
MKVRGLLFDTRSIQKYIFSGNKLKTNIGASYIVERLFEDVLCKEILEKKLKNFVQSQEPQRNFTVDVDSWEKSELVTEQLPTDCYVAYIGGGNALVLFSAEGADYRPETVKLFSKELLVLYPGVRIGAALGELSLDKEQFSLDLSELYKTLKDNQNCVSPNISIFDTGLTVPCETNGEVANYWYKENGQARIISQESFSKIDNSKLANETLQSEFSDVLENYEFPMELDDMGQEKHVVGRNVGGNDIAIVHIDGNNMGLRFRACKTLTDRSKLSKKVANKTKLAFKKLLSIIVDDKKKLELEGGRSNHKIPLRPLILGGDDITFVCNAQYVLKYTRLFMNFMKEELEPEDISIDTCAGIAILPTSYPFFRGYELAEQLCAVAKSESRNYKGSSWLDFALLHGEQAPELEQIRLQEYTANLGNMHFGPYIVNGIESNDPRHIDNLLQCIARFNQWKFSDNPAVSYGKVKELRFVLQKDEHEIQRYLELLGDSKSLLAVNNWESYEEKLWFEGKTPYVDAIELMDYAVGMED